MTRKNKRDHVVGKWHSGSVYALGRRGANMAIFMQETRSARLKANSTDLSGVKMHYRGK